MVAVMSTMLVSVSCMLPISVTDSLKSGIAYCTLSITRCGLLLQYVVETRYTGEEHEIPGASQQAIVGHHERVIPSPPVRTSAMRLLHLHD